MEYIFNTIKNQSKLRILGTQLTRSYHYQNSIFITNNNNLNSKIRVFDNYSSIVQSPQFYFHRNVRFFAAPVQVNAKPETKEPGGPRLNEKIRADVIRLVTDEGHDVVSRMEALRRASALNLDLVEVDRNAKPPVCKLMDYHREKYNKQLKDKDRAKSKTEVTLRKGDSKEVRFSMKIDQKDLEMKANTVKRLMERGYRVKCMAMGKEEEDLGGLVARLSALIEDVAIIESGPRVEKKQAYIVVRHNKFGPPKKGGSKKVSKTFDTPNPDTQNPTESNIEDDKIADQSGLETDDESPSEEVRYKRDYISVSPENRFKKPENTPVSEIRYNRPDNSSAVIENRYKRPENSQVVENRYNRANNSGPVDNRYNRETSAPVAENRYSRGNNSTPTENRYSRGNNSTPTENRYSQGNNSTPTENRYNRENNLPVTENRYSRVNNRENNAPATENRYAKNQQYNPNAEGGRPSTQFHPNDSRFPANGSNSRERPLENRYRNGNNFDSTRNPRPQGGPPTPPYTDGH